MCALYVNWKPEGKKPIEKRQSATQIPTGHNAVTWLAQELDPTHLEMKARKLLLRYLQASKMPNKSITHVAGAIVNGTDTFGFILKLAMRPTKPLFTQGPDRLTPEVTYEGNVF